MTSLQEPTHFRDAIFTFTNCSALHESIIMWSVFSVLLVRSIFFLKNAELMCCWRFFQHKKRVITSMHFRKTRKLVEFGRDSFKTLVRLQQVYANISDNWYAVVISQTTVTTLGMQSKKALGLIKCKRTVLLGKYPTIKVVSSSGSKSRRKP